MYNYNNNTLLLGEPYEPPHWAKIYLALLPMVVHVYNWILWNIIIIAILYCPVKQFNRTISYVTLCACITLSRFWLNVGVHKARPITVYYCYNYTSLTSFLGLKIFDYFTTFILIMSFFCIIKCSVTLLYNKNSSVSNKISEYTGE